MRITSVTNPRVKSAVKLRDRKGRDEQGRIVIDGIREIARALEGGARIVELFVCPERLDEDPAELMQRAMAARAQRFDVSSTVMEKLAFGQRAEGLLAVAETPRQSLTDVEQGFKMPLMRAGKTGNLAPLIAVLEGVEKPGNLGAVLRTADAAGIQALIVADGGTDLYNPNAIRASLGAIFTMNVCASTSAETRAWLRSGGWQIVAARVDGEKSYTQINFQRPTAIVLGSESHGLSAGWTGDDITAVSLPMLGHVDSLNVSATAAVLFYEARRQQGM